MSKWIAGWNMPGYLPEMEPETFETFAEAQDFIASELAEQAEACDESRVWRYESAANEVENVSERELSVSVEGDPYMYFIEINTAADES